MVAHVHLQSMGSKHTEPVLPERIEYINNILCRSIIILEEGFSPSTVVYTYQWHILIMQSQCSHTTAMAMLYTDLWTRDCQHCARVLYLMSWAECVVSESVGPLVEAQVDSGQSEVVGEGGAELVPAEGQVQQPHTAPCEHVWSGRR